jgi:hypothetical protein
MARQIPAGRHGIHRWLAAQPEGQQGVPLSTQHQMTRTGSDRGVEEWSCVQCSRRLLLRRPPAFQKVVLDRGNETAGHAAGGSGLRVGVTEVTPAGAADLSEDQHGWLAAHGIEWDTDGEG